MIIWQIAGRRDNCPLSLEGEGCVDLLRNEASRSWMKVYGLFGAEHPHPTAPNPVG